MFCSISKIGENNSFFSMKTKQKWSISLDTISWYGFMDEKLTTVTVAVCCAFEMMIRTRFSTIKSWKIDQSKEIEALLKKITPNRIFDCIMHRVTSAKLKSNLQGQLRHCS
jgi:hypothetical protein